MANRLQFEKDSNFSEFSPENYADDKKTLERINEEL